MRAAAPLLSVGLINWTAKATPDWNFLVDRAVTAEQAAALVRHDLGRVEVGCRADLIGWDDDWNVRAVWQPRTRTADVRAEGCPDIRPYRTR